MKSQAKTPEEYLASVPAERRKHLERLRTLVKKSVPAATERMSWGMIGFAINGRPFVAMASQKSYLSLYLMDLYTQPRLRAQHATALKPLKMGKSCINFKSVDDLPLDTIGAILKEAPSVVVTGGTMAAQTANKTAAKKKSKK